MAFLAGGSLACRLGARLWLCQPTPVQLRKIATVAHPAPTAGGDGSWREARFGPVRIKLRASTDEYDLAPLLPGDVLATVSRRDPIRDRIGVWTSGNRVLGLANPGPVTDLINRCHHDLDKARFTLARTLDHADILGIPAHAATRLFDLLLVELQEHLDQHTTIGGPAYERTGHP